MTASMSAPNIQVGTKLPELKLYGDPTFIVSTAIATTAIIKSISLRLGVPWYAYDTVAFKGEVTAVEAADARSSEGPDLITLQVVGSNSLGDHVIATATLTIGGA
jgi:hypothetical protein